MTDLQRRVGEGYWYGDESADQRARRVLNALRDYRASEAAMRRRTRASMGMGETDLLALRYLLQAQQEGVAISPKDLAARLGISSAATTTLIDRLVKSEHVERQPHPTDRRALVIVATPNSDHEVRATLADMHHRMLSVAADLDPAAAQAVVEFLEEMARAVDQIDAHAVVPAGASR